MFNFWYTYLLPFLLGLSIIGFSSFLVYLIALRLIALGNRLSPKAKNRLFAAVMGAVVVGGTMASVVVCHWLGSYILGR